MVQDTSRAAYALADLPGNQHRVLFALLSQGPLCNYDIAIVTRMKINCVTPATLALRKAGLVREAYRAINPATGMTSIYWEVGP